MLAVEWSFDLILKNEILQDTLFTFFDCFIWTNLHFVEKHFVDQVTKLRKPLEGDISMEADAWDMKMSHCVADLYANRCTGVVGVDRRQMLIYSRYWCNLEMSSSFLH